jgi:hypothetical protein
MHATSLVSLPCTVLLALLGLAGCDGFRPAAEAAAPSAERTALLEPIRHAAVAPERAIGALSFQSAYIGFESLPEVATEAFEGTLLGTTTAPRIEADHRVNLGKRIAEVRVDRVLRGDLQPGDTVLVVYGEIYAEGVAVLGDETLPDLATTAHRRFLFAGHRGEVNGIEGVLVPEPGSGIAALADGDRLVSTREVATASEVRAALKTARP